MGNGPLRYRCRPQAPAGDTADFADTANIAKNDATRKIDRHSNMRLIVLQGGHVKGLGVQEHIDLDFSIFHTNQKVSLHNLTVSSR